MLRRKHLAIRWRLTGWVLAIVFAIIAVGGVVVVRLVHDRLLDRVDEDNQQLSQEVVTALDLFGADTVAAAAEQGVGSSDQVLMLVTNDGVEWAFPSGPDDDPDPLPDISDLDVAELRASAGVPFDVSGGDGAPDYRMLPTQMGNGQVLLVGTSLDKMDDAMRGLVGALVVVAVIAAVVMTVTVSFVAASVTRPLEGMVATAERIGSGALDERVTIEGVDDVARLAAALNAMLDRLERAFADRQASEDKLRQFVADASHELRTPVTAVLGYAELLQSGMATTDEDVASAVSRIAAEGERMRLLVEELLLLARLDEQRQVDRIDVDLGELVAVAVADARAVAPDRQIDVRAGPPHVVVRGDPLSLRQAVDNLITNARVHTPDGTRVEVEVAKHAGDAVVTVDDDGPGIDESDVPHLFDRFYRSERSRPRGGAGLGLSIVAAVASAHGGTVAVGPSPLGGARFTITVPATTR
jgi:two-component system OmpR family sensor kinase